MKYGIWTPARRFWYSEKRMHGDYLKDERIFTTDDINVAFAQLSNANFFNTNYQEQDENGDWQAHAYNWQVAIITRIGQPKINEELKIANESHRAWVEGGRKINTDKH